MNLCNLLLTFIMCENQVSFFKILFIYLWLCWVFVSVRGLSLVAASGGHSSSRCADLSLSQTSNCGSRAQLLRGMWDLPRPGLEPVSPALAGRLSTTAPPGKPIRLVLIMDMQEKELVRKMEKSGNQWKYFIFSLNSENGKKICDSKLNTCKYFHIVV